VVLVLRDSLSSTPHDWVVVLLLRLLVDGDASRLVLLGLGDDDAQDTILEGSRDGVLVDAGGEVEAARELAKAALSEPVLGRVGRLLLDLLLGLLNDFGALLVGLGLSLILNCGVVRALAVVAALGDGTARGSVFNQTSRGSAGSVGALGLAADEHCLGLGEFDVDVLLAHSRELAVELIGLCSLADIKLRLPVAQTTAAAILSLSLARVAVEVVEEAEEGSEGGVGVVEVAGEESHFVWLVGDGVECGLLQVDCLKSLKELICKVQESFVDVACVVCLYVF